MIISCPECAGPFEVPDDRIAALTQVACPHCAFRMILDFAAANDPALVEQGMRMASGFRSASDYQASAGSPSGLATPVAAPAPVPEVAEATTGEPVAPADPPTQVVQAPRPTPSTPPVRTTPAAEIPPVRQPPARVAARSTQVDPDLAVPSTPPVRQPRPQPPIPEPTVDLDEEAPTIAPGQFQLPPGGIVAAMEAERAKAEAEAAQAAQAAQAAAPPPAATPAELDAHPPFGEDDDDLPTMIVPPEARELARAHIEAERAAAEAKAQAEADTLAATRDAEAQAQAQAEARAQAPAARVDREPEVDTSPSGRLPPHTPPGRAKPSLGGDDDEAESSGLRPTKEPGKRPATSAPNLQAVDSPTETTGRRMSTFGVVTVVVLLLLALGLVGASLALENTLDPRPLLEKMYRQIKG